MKKEKKKSEDVGMVTIVEKSDRIEVVKDHITYNDLRLLSNIGARQEEPGSLSANYCENILRFKQSRTMTWLTRSIVVLTIVLVAPTFVSVITTLINMF